MEKKRVFLKSNITEKEIKK